MRRKTFAFGAKQPQCGLATFGEQNLKAYAPLSKGVLNRESNAVSGSPVRFIIIENGQYYYYLTI
jgi:hypothetical protein